MTTVAELLEELSKHMHDDYLVAMDDFIFLEQRAVTDVRWDHERRQMVLETRHDALPK